LITWSLNGKRVLCCYNTAGRVQTECRRRPRGTGWSVGRCAQTMSTSEQSIDREAYQTDGPDLLTTTPALASSQSQRSVWTSASWSILSTHHQTDRLPARCGAFLSTLHCDGMVPQPAAAFRYV